MLNIFHLDHDSSLLNINCVFFSELVAQELIVLDVSTAQMLSK